MTQMERVDRRTTVLLPALVAAVVSTIITVTGVFFFIGQPSAGSLGQPASINASAQDAAVRSGRAWEAQRAQQSLSAIQLGRAKDAAVVSGIEWELRYQQTTPRNR